MDFKLAANSKMHKNTTLSEKKDIRIKKGECQEYKDSYCQTY